MARWYVAKTDAFNAAISGGSHKVVDRITGSVVFHGTRAEADAWAARLNGTGR
jgi:hypothetical protein